MSDYIPIEQWSKDHWSTLAYVESVMVDCAGFQVGADPRMKSNRRHFRVMAAECPNPRRAQASKSLAMPMRPEHATRLKDGTQIAGHDDWMCVQDMAAAGLFTAGPDDVQPGERLHLSALGVMVSSELRAHKASGGTFATFSPSGAALQEIQQHAAEVA